MPLSSVPTPLPAPRRSPLSRSSPPIRVRPATTRDLVDSAALHVMDLPGGLFTRLGPRFVARWHRTYLQSSYGIAYVATVPCTRPHACRTDDHVVGFLVGSVDRRSFVADVLDRHRTELARAGLMALLLRPRTMTYFLRTRAGAYARRLRAPSADPALAPRTSGPVAELTAIAVACSHRGRGAGVALVDAFVDECDRSGAPTAELVTAFGRDGAGEFYRHAGWTDVGVETARDGSLLRRFRRRGPVRVEQ